MKTLSKILLIAYLLALLWLVLFKSSLDIVGVFAVHIQSINLIPFAGISQDLRGMIDNTTIFIPLGLLLSANFKHISLAKKFAFILSLSVAVEIFQFIFSIGITDITDVITNSVGGLIGLIAYDIAKKRIETKSIDQFVIIVTTGLLLLVLLLRFLVFKVRY